jgi:hypothetical protein
MNFEKPVMQKWLQQTWTYQTLRHWHGLLRDHQYRAKNRLDRDNFSRFCHQDGGLGLRHNLLPKGLKPKTGLIVSQSYLPFTRLEALMIKALQMAGFNTVVVRNRRYDFLRYIWLAGNKTVYELTDFDSHGDPEWVDQQVSLLVTLNEWLALQYQGVHVGRFTIASALRRLRIGQLNFTDPLIQARLRGILKDGVRNTLAARKLMDKVKPDCVILMDRGYAGQGEIFDLAINQGIDTITWHMGHKNNCLVVKRYHLGNEREHPFAPSEVSWRQVCSIPWKSDYGRQIREDLLKSYKAQDWFSFVGTQFDKQILSKQATREQLGLSTDKKVAVIFPHILWDGSFFSGDDLFDDYTQWFVETIRAACANPRLQWVIKLHPAHLVKAKQNRDSGSPAELNVIQDRFSCLPAHIKVIHPDTDLSTYSLLQIADYTVTVRGTVGIESALFGIPVITAGTGRYDRRGFTLDSSTREQYLQKLAKLETFPRLSAEQVELAERYYYGVYVCRPLSLSSVSLEFARDELATPKVVVHCQSRVQWLSAPDMQRLASWMADDAKAEDMPLLLPLTQRCHDDGVTRPYPEAPALMGI